MEGKLHKPKFIPYFLNINNQYGLTPTQTLLYGFIVYVLKLGNKYDAIFYYANDQLSEIIGCSEDTIKDCFTALHEKQLIFRDTKFVKNINRRTRVVTLNEKIIDAELKTSPYQPKVVVRGENPTSVRGENPTYNYNIKNNNINKEKNLEQETKELINYLDGKTVPDGLTIPW